MSVRIAQENPNDAICLQLIAELSTELGARYGDDGSGSFQPEEVTVPRAAFLVAWLEGEPVGCGALRPMSDARVGEIKRMYVRPEARRRGISRQILAELEALADEFDYEEIWLETGTRQREAMDLYESSGYRRIPCFGRYADDPLSVCYGKSLQVQDG